MRIGTITYSDRSMFTSVEETLGALLQNGLSEVELMGGPIESFAGMRPSRIRGKKGGPVDPAAKPGRAAYGHSQWGP